MAEAKKLNLYEKLADIRTMVGGALKKDKSGYGYTYTSEEEILARVTTGMRKHKVSLLPGIVPGTIKVSPYTYTKTKLPKNATTPIEERVNEILVDAEMTWTWVDDENPSSTVVVPWVLIGQQSDAAQAFGSGLTYTTRYFLLKYFQVATVDDDPDNFRSKQQKTEAESKALVSTAIIAEIDAVVQPRLPSMDDAQKKKLLADIQKVCIIDSKASQNYRAIKDPTVATNVLSAVKKYFGIEVAD